MEVGLVPFPDALSLLEYWADSPPPSESIRALLSAFTDWEPANKQTGKTEEKRDLLGLATETRTRALSASALPSYMKDALSKDFGLSIN